MSSHLADNGQVALAPEIVTRRASVRAGKGETVATLARRYKGQRSERGRLERCETERSLQGGPASRDVPARRQGISASARAQARSAPGKGGLCIHPKAPWRYAIKGAEALTQSFGRAGQSPAP